jgi:hypothetical protein
MEDEPNTKMSQKEYMRLYKRKQYAEKPDDIKAKNKAYYAKYKYGMSSEDMKKYDTLLPLVSKIKKNYEELKEKNIVFLKDILAVVLGQMDCE